MAAQRDSASKQDDVEPLLSGYRPLPGIFDEMVDRDGRARAHWRPFLAMLAALGPQEINRRFAAADRHLHDSGVFYRVYEDPAGAERPWPLSHVPLLISAAEWQVLEAGLVERAELLEAVLVDTYGPAYMRVAEQLDQCWDLLRQRRARREFGQDPEAAKLRDEKTVKGYIG